MIRRCWTKRPALGLRAAKLGGHQGLREWRLWLAWYLGDGAVSAPLLLLTPLLRFERRWAPERAYRR